MNWLIVSSLQLAVLTTLIALVCVIFRKCSANIRFVLFLLIFVKVLIPPSFGLPWGVGNWGIEPARQFGRRVSESFFSPDTPEAVSDKPTVKRSMSDGEREAFRNETERLRRELAAERAAARSVVSSEPAVSFLSRITSKNIALGVWLAGVVLSLALLILSAARLTRLIRRAEPITDGELTAPLAGSRARLYLSDETPVPFVAGFWRQKIVLPRVLVGSGQPAEISARESGDDSPSSERKRLMENILLHERAHIERRDLPIAYFVALVRSVFWFHPFLWWAGLQLAHWRELACDESVLASNKTTSDGYGRALLDTLLLARGKNQVNAAALGIFERNVKLQKRLEEIMSYQRRTKRAIWLERLLPLVFALVFLPMGYSAFSGEKESANTASESANAAQNEPDAPETLAVKIDFYVLASENTSDEKERALIDAAKKSAAAEYKSDSLPGYDGALWLKVPPEILNEWSNEQNAASGRVVRSDEVKKNQQAEVLALIPEEQRRVLSDDFVKIEMKGDENGALAFWLSDAGGERMTRLTAPLAEAAKRGENRQLAFVVNDELLSAMLIMTTVSRKGIISFGRVSEHLKELSVHLQLLGDGGRHDVTTQMAEPAARKPGLPISCRDHLKMILLAFHYYNDANGGFPPCATTDKEGKPLHSWRVLLLPFMGQIDLYKKIRLDEPWDSEWNRPFHHQMPDVYRCGAKDFGPGMTVYSVVKGKGSMFPKPGVSPVILDMEDGLSNTLAVVERKKPVCWMDPAGDLTMETAVKNGVNSPSEDGIGSAHPGGVWFAMFDGTARTFYDSDRITAEELSAILTPAGGESISVKAHGALPGNDEEPISSEQEIKAALADYLFGTARLPLYDSELLQNETLRAAAREEIGEYQRWKTELNRAVQAFTDSLDENDERAFRHWRSAPAAKLNSETYRELWKNEPALRPALLFYLESMEARLRISNEVNERVYGVDLPKKISVSDWPKDEEALFVALCGWYDDNFKVPREQAQEFAEKAKKYREQIGKPIPDELLALLEEDNRRNERFTVYSYYDSCTDPEGRQTLEDELADKAAKLDRMAPGWREKYGVK